MPGGWLPWALIILGVLFLLEQFEVIQDVGQFWPLILVLIGVSMLLPERRPRRTDPRDPGHPAAAPAPPSPPPSAGLESPPANQPPEPPAQ